MAIYTPRGLKIRIPVPVAFGLMARLHPKVTPFRILKTAEGLESLPGMLAFSAGIFAFTGHLSPVGVAVSVGWSYVAGVLITQFGWGPLPGLVGLATLYSYIAGYGLFIVTAVLVGLITSGWQAVLAFFAGYVLAQVLGLALEFQRAARYHRLTGLPLTGSEVNFFNAYRLHARRVGVTSDIHLAEEELRDAHWLTVFEDFARSWPEVVARFTPD